ncbi:MAG TPA: GNAT family N-acetyltransferase [Porticoccus sp.]|nr:GNAT family N-acetyltransferase [Porticoccus sp.]
MLNRDEVCVFNIGEVQQFMPEIKALSDRNKKYLGMLPYSAMEQHAKRGEILVLIVNRSFAGYLLFRPVPSFRRLSITHLCLDEEFRGGLLTQRLLDQLKAKCIEQQYSGISLNCRHDYGAAKKVWANNGFYPVREKNGRGKGDYQVVTWWWANSSAPSLFESYEGNPEKINGVIDVNTLINLKENDISTAALTGDWLVNEIELSITKETYVELLRHEEALVREESRTFAGRFPMVEANDEIFDEKLKELEAILPLAITPQDKSDRRQLAYTYSANIEVFITSDVDLLSFADLVREKCGMHMFKPEEFVLHVDETLRESMYRPARFAGTRVSMNKIASLDLNLAQTQFRHNQERKSTFTRLLRAAVSDVHNTEVYLIRDGSSQLLGMFSMSSIADKECVVRILRINAGSLSFTLAAQVLDSIIKKAIVLMVEQVRIVDSYAEISHQLLSTFGFYLINNQYVKLCDYTARSLQKLKNIMDKKVHIKGSGEVLVKELIPCSTASPLWLEKALSPAKALDADVPIYVIPIKPHWAMELFDHRLALEDLFGSKPELAFSYENAYYTATKQIIQAPGRIVWYVSKGSSTKSSSYGKIRAISYLDEVTFGCPKELFKKYRRLGIYSWKDVLNAAGGDMNRKIQALLFSRTELLSNPMSLAEFKKLQREHGVAENNLPGPLKITPALFESIYKRT